MPQLRPSVSKLRVSSSSPVVSLGHASPREERSDSFARMRVATPIASQLKLPQKLWMTRRDQDARMSLALPENEDEDARAEDAIL